MKTAKQMGLGVCPECYKVNMMEVRRQRCSRCSNLFFQRKPNSLQYTLAWTIAAFISFIPANIYPIMIVYSLGIPEASTILSGIGTFIEYGLYPMAVIIFTASIIVPVIKIVGLLFLVFKVKAGLRLTPAKHTKLYHVLEFLGPWSMLDVFVVALMVAVVELGFVSTVEAGPAINYFTLTVIFTMIAAISFDPRLLWDENNKTDCDL
jgi:paraquat-inducible protein A|tara:strand:- start:2418 stop:3038 length:621 start_codon:yes stop_codon:yes gene_type:complete